VSTLLYCHGEEANDVLTSTNITLESRKKFASVTQKFDKFFKIWKYVIFKKAQFNRCSQGETKTVEQFITSLHSLARCAVNLHDIRNAKVVVLKRAYTLQHVDILVHQCYAIS